MSGNVVRWRLHQYPRSIAFAKVAPYTWRTFPAQIHSHSSALAWLHIIAPLLRKWRSAIMRRHEAVTTPRNIFVTVFCPMHHLQAKTCIRVILLSQFCRLLIPAAWRGNISSGKLSFPQRPRRSLLYRRSQPMFFIPTTAPIHTFIKFSQCLSLLHENVDGFIYSIFWTAEKLLRSRDEWCIEYFDVLLFTFEWFTLCAKFDQNWSSFKKCFKLFYRRLFGYCHNFRSNNSTCACVYLPLRGLQVSYLLIQVAFNWFFAH